MLRNLLLWSSENRWLKHHLPRRAFVRRAVRRFMPGEDLASALGAAEDLRARGASTVLTLLGENVADEAEIRGVQGRYSELLGEIVRRSIDAEISIKPTHLGLDLNGDLATSGIERLAAASAAQGKTLWVDMEGSAYLDRTLDLFRRVHAQNDRTGLCLQAYLRRTASDLDGLLSRAPKIRLVKGAYAEPRSIAFASRQEVDDNFLRLAARLLDAAAGRDDARVAFATHDRALIARILELAAARSLPPSAFEFQMLYGIQRAEQERLARAGYRVRVLISFGSAWFPWYMRRLAERPANVWFVVRNLFAR